VARRANAQQPLPRQRRDFHHQQARQVVQADDVIYHEDLRVAHLVQTHLVQTHHRATSIREAGWSALLALLACKAASAGKRVPAVHPAFTSQACSGCGVIVQKGLSDHWHTCPDCGTSLHRDHNAAMNILRLGKGTVGRDTAFGRQRGPSGRA